VTSASVAISPAPKYLQLMGEEGSTLARQCEAVSAETAAVERPVSKEK